MFGYHFEVDCGTTVLKCPIAGIVTTLAFYQRGEGKVVFLKRMKCTGLEKVIFFSFFNFGWLCCKVNKTYYHHNGHTNVHKCT